MPSQLELLKEALDRALARSGPDSPFVKGLKMQIAMHEKPRSENPMSQDKQTVLSVGSRKA